MDFVRGDAILGIDHHPQCTEPRTQLDGAIFKDGSKFHAVMLLTARTDPHPTSLDEAILLGVTAGTGRTLWPSHNHSEIYAALQIGKVVDGFLKSGR